MSILSSINKYRRARRSAEPSPEQCFTETMLGPRSSGPCTQVQLPDFAYLSRRAQSYHCCVWANPANPAYPHRHLVSLGSTPLIQSCRRKKKPPFLVCVLSFALLLHTHVHLEEGEETWQCSFPHSLISENILFPNPAGDEGNRAGCLPRWNIGFCLLPIAILQGPTLRDE